MPQPMKHIVVAGEQYHRWTVIEELPVANKNRWLRCRCKCGSVVIVNLYSVVSGRSKSCGCHNLDVIRAASENAWHRDFEYKCWRNFITRCENPKATGFDNYGGRGIKVCDRWRRSYEIFLADMGRCPSPKHSIERIDVNGDYTPQNCRWATRVEQARNKRNNRKLAVNGETKLLCEWSAETGLDSSLILKRIRLYGWPVERAVLTPARSRKMKK